MNIRSRPSSRHATTRVALRPNPLAACLLAVTGGLASSWATAAVTHVVTTCNDTVGSALCDGDDGTLRKALRCAQNKDTVDLTQLQCSTITLATSLIAGTVTVTLNGPGRDKLTIDAGGRFRAIIHNGVYSNALYIKNLTITNGHYDNPYDYSNGGGCIYSSSYVSVTSSTVSNCYTSAIYKAATGGAIFARKGASVTDTIV